jgi:transcriptional regulator with PAS, ATPase and Fis domain
LLQRDTQRATTEALPMSAESDATLQQHTARASAAHKVVRYTKVLIRMTSGADAGANIETAGQRVRIGTASDNDLVLTDQSVSRHHCELEPTPHGMRVIDLASTNGVLLGSVRLSDAVVPGDVRLMLGDAQISVRWLDETVDREQLAGDRFGDVLGSSDRMRELFADLERIATTDVTLLLEGETGTGKDLIAESVHGLSRRCSGPFVLFDGGAAAPGIIESELFGHERGAFTGALATHIGVFEQAHGGTLFLDEIGELPLEMQPKLLRLLEKRQLKRVGGRDVIDVDVRIVAATNRNLRTEMQRGRFREDLYYRLAGAHVRVPPLRDRLDDLELLVGHFLAQHSPPRDLASLPPDVWAMFRAHRWPGNVRELKNAVERLAVMPDEPLTASGDEVDAGPRPLRMARGAASDAFERAYLERVLAATGGNVTHAAALAEVSRQMIQKLMRKHGLGESR